MLRHPVISLFLRDRNLTGTKTSGNQGHPGFAGFIATSLRENRPKVGPHRVRRYTTASPVAVAQHSLSGDIALLGSQGKPANCLTVVLRNLVTSPVMSAHIKLSGGVTTVSQFL